MSVDSTDRSVSLTQVLSSIVGLLGVLVFLLRGCSSSHDPEPVSPFIWPLSASACERAVATTGPRYILEAHPPPSGQLEKISALATRAERLTGSSVRCVKSRLNGLPLAFTALKNGSDLASIVVYLRVPDPVDVTGFPQRIPPSATLGAMACVAADPDSATGRAAIEMCVEQAGRYADEMRSYIANRPRSATATTAPGSSPTSTGTAADQEKRIGPYRVILHTLGSTGHLMVIIDLRPLQDQPPDPTGSTSTSTSTTAATTRTQR